MKPENAPIWYSIYERFPPKLEPMFFRPEPKTEIRDIFYQEDQLRAEIKKNFGNINGVVDLSSHRQTKTQYHIKSFQLEKNKSNDSAAAIKAVIMNIQDKFNRGKQIKLEPDTESKSELVIEDLFKEK